MSSGSGSSQGQRPAMRPTAIFAVPPAFINRAHIEEAFAHAGIQTFFATQSSEIVDKLKEPESYVLFLDLLFSQDPLGLLQKLRSVKTFVAIILAEHLSPAERQSLYNMGAKDCLLRPVHPRLLLSKAEAMLRDAIAAKTLPPNTVLPQGFKSPGRPTTSRAPEQKKTTTVKPITIPAPKTPEPVKTKSVPSPAPAPQTKAKTVFQPNLLPSAAAALNPSVATEEDSVKKAWIDQYRSRYPSLERIEPLLAAYAQQGRLFSPSKEPSKETAEAIQKSKALALAPFREMVNTSEALLADATQALRAYRTVVVSLVPHALWPAEECPTQLFALLSSDEKVPCRKTPLATVLLPQIPMVFRAKSPILLTNQMPTQMGPLARPNDWLVDGKAEGASAVIPLFESRRLFGAALVQYANFEDSYVPLLEQSLHFLKAASEVYARVDFLGRVYREMDTADS